VTKSHEPTEREHCERVADEIRAAGLEMCVRLLMSDREAVRADAILAREAAIARAERAELELDEVKREASEQAAKLSLLVLAVEAVLNKADVEGIREWRCIRALRRVLEGAK
jgi:hypothetical protein